GAVGACDLSCLAGKGDVRFRGTAGDGGNQHQAEQVFTHVAIPKMSEAPPPRRVSQHNQLRPPPEARHTGGAGQKPPARTLERAPDSWKERLHVRNCLESRQNRSKPQLKAVRRRCAAALPPKVLRVRVREAPGPKA